MAIVKTDSDNYSSIANAIRYKNGTSNKYKPAEMANAIKALSGSGAANPTLQSKIVTPTKSSQEITYDTGYDGLEKVTVESIPDAYIQPSGTKSITSNGTYDVTNYSSANVNVESSGSDTSDATAYSEDIVKDKTAYARGTKITGTLQEKGDTNSSTVITNSPTLSTNNTTLYADAPAFTERTLYKKNASLSIGINLSEFGNADPSDVVSGKTFTSANGLKVSGTGSFISTSDATATADNIEQNYTAYVNSEKITGTVKSGNAFNLIANSSTYSNEGTVSYSASSGTGSTDMPDRISIKYTNNTKQIIPSKGTVIASAKASLFGDATVADVVSGKTFTSKNGLKLEGEAILGTNTNDATATPYDMAENITAYVKGEKITGNLPTVSQITSSNTTISNDSDNLILSNVNSSKKIIDTNSTLILKTALSNFGDATETDVIAGKTFTSANGLKITGVATIDGSGIDTSDATATANDIAEGKTAYINGEKVSGNLVSQSPGSSGEGSATYSTSTIGGTTLKFINTKTIASRDSIVRKDQEYSMSISANHFGNATVDDVASGKTFTSINGLQLTGTANISSSGSSIKIGTITGSNTINTGLSNIQYLTIYKTSTGISAVGFLHGFYNANESKTWYTYCSSYSQYVKSCSYSSASDMTIDGGIFTWAKNLDSSMGFISNSEYTWVAIGTE